jgi:hypothetical protein
MNNATKIFVSLSASTLIGSVAAADMTGMCYQNIQQVSAVDGFGASDFNGTVVDLWLEFDSVDDVMLNVYNFNDINLGTTYYQSFTGSGWQPNNQGAPFETDALAFADSYITIGGAGDEAQDANNGTGVDPNFGGNTAAGPDVNGGWYNSNPTVEIGAVVVTGFTDTGFGVFIGRFSVNGGELDMASGTGFATWNQGIGTDGSQADFEIIVPAPGALALLGLAGLAGRRRRN